MTDLSIPGIHYGLSNAEYHRSPGISNSGLGLINESPANFIWNRDAPVDEEKTKALDMGTALHCILLEPDEFKDRFIIAPEFNRRTTAGKAEEQAFLSESSDLGKTIMTTEEGRKLNLMRESALAHPDARWLLEADGHAEASIYWNDSETGELCRIRPDRILTHRPIVIDVKKVDGMDRFRNQVFEFGYHRQDAMYCDGYKQHFGEDPLFLFLIVSSTVNCGRYPVRVRPLDDEAKDLGRALYRKNLNEYHRCRTESDWHDFHPIDVPYWAKRT